MHVWRLEACRVDWATQLFLWRMVHGPWCVALCRPGCHTSRAEQFVNATFISALRRRTPGLSARSFQPGRLLREPPCRCAPRCWPPRTIDVPRGFERLGRENGDRSQQQQSGPAFFPALVAGFISVEPLQVSATVAVLPKYLEVEVGRGLQTFCYPPASRVKHNPHGVPSDLSH